MSDTNKEITLSEKQSLNENGGEPTRPDIRFSPTVDIYETEEALTLLADLPGVSPDALDIDLDDKKLTVTGRVEAPEKRFTPLYREYGIGGFTRSFELGDTIDRSRISATLTDGVLTLVLPKADRLKPRKIAVATA